MRALILWTPRLLGLAFALFVAAFALDVLDEPGRRGLALAVAAHLAPAAAVLAATLVGWRWPVVGGALFAVLAVGYVLMAGPDRPVSWYAVIAGPALVIGMLFAGGPLAASGVRGGPGRSPTIGPRPQPLD